MTCEIPTIIYKFDKLGKFALDHYINNGKNHMVYLEIKINNEFKDILWIKPEEISLCSTHGLSITLQVIGVDLI